MYISGEGLLILIVVGVVSGWLAGKIVDGTGFGLIGDFIIGIIGAFIGSWLLPRIGLHLAIGILGAVINATLGAIVLLLVIRLVAGRRSNQGFFGFRRRW